MFEAITHAKTPAAPYDYPQVVPLVEVAGVVPLAATAAMASPAAAAAHNPASCVASGDDAATIALYDRENSELAWKQCKQSVCYDVMKHSNNYAIAESRIHDT